MSFSSQIASFLRSFSSVFDVTGAAKAALSAAIADGVNAGVKRATEPLAELLANAALVAAGVLLLAWGVGTALDAALHTPGAGYALTGIALLALAYVRHKTTG